MALDVIKAQKKLGKEAPKDFQIIGFDGVKLSLQKRLFTINDCTADRGNGQGFSRNTHGDDFK